MRESIALVVSESSQAGEARRVAIALALRLGFNESERGKVGIVVTELANNLVRYGQEGLLLLQEIQQQAITGIEILSLDKGPGIANIDECLQDGFSTGHTAGNGLGAIKRLSGFFDIYSIRGMGTAIVSQLWSMPLSSTATQGRLDLSAICLPKAGEDVAGDTWASRDNSQGCLLLVSDGLGHGLQAAQASLEAVRVFERQSHLRPKEIIEAAHQALRSTRGAAVAIAQIDFEAQTLCFAGIGNIAGVVLSAERHSNLVSLNGTVGYTLRKVQEFIYPWNSTGLLILHSDGLGSQWQLERYPGLNQKHPSLIAGILYRDFNRAKDDVTVVVAREAR